MVASFKRDAGSKVTPKVRQYAVGTLLETPDRRVKGAADNSEGFANVIIAHQS
jgi:hypothetical protein